ncbi:MAG: Holliday junction branch migration protein RuvA [Actinomycetes bacterium]|jgi:Holliday junction DNA helicase RuvA
MISTLTGTIRSLAIDKVVIEVGGVGFTLLINPQTSSGISLGAQTTLHTSLVVREDSLTLFGFLSEEVKNLFELVQTVSGVGPKVALSIMGALTPEDLARAISQEDISAIERVPGIGKKGAQRMILELKGKLSDLSPGTSYKGHQPAWREQLTSALVSLGFSPKESDGAISFVVNDLRNIDADPAKMELSELLKLALASGKSSRG